MLIPRRPLGLPEDVPLLANPPRVDISPELAKILHTLGRDDIEAAWFEYHRRRDIFRDSPEGLAYWNNLGALSLQATGVSLDEFDALDAAYWEWRESRIDHDEIERATRRWVARVVAGDTTCGYCGTKYTTHGAMLAHMSGCSFKPSVSLGLELWRNRS